MINRAVLTVPAIQINKLAQPIPTQAINQAVLTMPAIQINKLAQPIPTQVISLVAALVIPIAVEVINLAAKARTITLEDNHWMLSHEGTELDCRPPLLFN